MEAWREGFEATASSAKHTFVAIINIIFMLDIIIIILVITTIILFIKMVITKRTYKKEARHSTQTPLQKSTLLSSVERSARAPPDFASLITSV